MKLVAGSYERFLFGYHLAPTALKDELPDDAQATEPRPLSAAFTYAAHLGPIKSLAASGSYLVSGGSDDIIRIYDVKASKDMGFLTEHQGAVTCLEFYGSLGVPTHLLSGSEDGSVLVWDTVDWQFLKRLGGHKSPVNDLTLHPSGKLALSVSRDGHLKMWDLIKGRCSYTTRTSGEALLVAFSPQAGNAYCTAVEDDVIVHDAQVGKEKLRLAGGSKVLSWAQDQDDVLVTGCEEGHLQAWDVSSGKSAMHVPNAHSKRIRGVALPGAIGTGPAQTLPTHVATASSDGFIKVWDTRLIRRDLDRRTAPAPLYEIDTKARLTCLVVGGAKGKNRKEAPVGKGGVEGANQPSTSGAQENGESGPGAEAVKIEGEKAQPAAVRQRKVKAAGRGDAPERGAVKRSRGGKGKKGPG